MSLYKGRKTNRELSEDNHYLLKERSRLRKAIHQAIEGFEWISKNTIYKLDEIASDQSIEEIKTIIGKKEWEKFYVPKELK